MAQSQLTNAERALVMIRGMEEQRLEADMITTRAEQLLARHLRAVDLCDGLTGCDDCKRGNCANDVKIIARLEADGVLKRLDELDITFNEERDMHTDFASQLYATPGFSHLGY
jgi:hypothetical protein